MSLNQVESDPVETRNVFPTASGRHDHAWLVILAWAVVCCAIIVALGPLLIIYGRQLWNAEHYQFVSVLLLAVGWLTWTRWKSLPIERTLPHSMAARVLAWSAALLLTGAAVVAISPLLSFIALLALALAGLYEWRGTPGLRHFLPAWGVLLLAVRPPFKWDQQIIFTMQQIATDWGSGVLDLMGVHHMASGVVIRLPEQEFFVAEACSGVHSLFATLAFIAVYSAIMHRGLPRVLCLLMAGVFWVLVANILRVLAVVILSSRYHLPVIEGVGHELLGIAVFAIVILMVLSADRLLMYLVPPRETLPNLVAVEDHTIAAKPPVTSALGRTILAVAVASCFVMMAGTTRMLPAAQVTTGPLFAPSQGLVEVPENALPERWNGWEKVQFEFRENEHEMQGEFSRIWNFRKGRLQAAISIDGPFPEWHDTEFCYRGLGYTTQLREEHFLDDGQDHSGGFTELVIKGDHASHGYVLFMAYAENGRALRPPAASRHASIARLLSLWRRRVAETAPRDPIGARVFQVQLFSEGAVPTSDSEQAELRALFHEMRARIAKYVSGKRNPDNSMIAEQN